MAEATPHASKAAAVLQIEAAELTALSVNPKNGSKTVPFKRPIRVRFGGKSRDTALRCPFGAPKSFDPTKTDRVSFSVSVSPESDEARYAARLDEKAKSLLKARLPEFMERATPAQVELLADAMDVYAALIERTTGVRVANAPGAGASGGIGAAVMGLLSGVLHPRYDLVMQYLDIDALIAEADLVITAEGSLDGQTPYGKVPVEVARRAKLRGLPVIALAGTIGKGAASNFAYGIDAFASIVKRPCSLDEAIEKADKFLVRAAEDATRMILVGMMLAAGSAVTDRRLRRRRVTRQDAGATVVPFPRAMSREIPVAG